MVAVGQTFLSDMGKENSPLHSDICFLLFPDFCLLFLRGVDSCLPFWTLIALIILLSKPLMYESACAQGYADDARKLEKVSRGLSTDAQYSARDSVLYDIERGVIYLKGKAKVKYRKMELSAERITYYVNDQSIQAKGVQDSTGKMVGTPVFRDGSETFGGLEIKYNLKTERGTIIQGNTEFQKGFYLGQKIRKVAPRVLNVDSGKFTTCDLVVGDKEPHYDFYSSKMKIIEDDKVIAKSVMFRIDGVPVMWFPFLIFPIKKGRHSGITTPSYGSNGLDGRLIKNLGYYWAANQYWDTTFRSTFREKTGLFLEADLRYALRYHFKGSLNFDFENRTRGGKTTTREWRLNFQHSQPIGRTMSLRGSGSFVSNRNFNSENSHNLFDRLQRTLRSHITFNKRWRTSGNSVEIRMRHEKNLTTSETLFEAPTLSFRKNRKPIFGRLYQHSLSSKSNNGDADRPRWYNSIFYSYSGNINNTRRTRLVENQLTDQNTFRTDHRLNIASQQKLLRWLNVTPNFSTRQRWTRSPDGLYTGSESYSTSASSNTTLYGLFNISIGQLKAVRHVAKPSLSFGYSRDVTETGDKFGFGGKRNVGDPRKTLSMRLGNILQVKTEKEGRERKFDLITYDLSTSYDFAEERLRDLNTSLSIKPVRRFDVRMRATYDFYPNDRRDLFLPDLKRLSVTSVLRLNGGGRRKTKERKDAEEFDSSRSDALIAPRYGVNSTGATFEDNFNEDFLEGGRPWRLNFSHTYSVNRRSLFTSSFATRDTTIKTSWLKGSISLNLTRNWRMDYSFNVNLSPDRGEDRITGQSYSFYRDLHGWEARFRWTPSGVRNGYFFKINIKELPQVKFERRQGVGRFQ